MSNPFNKLKVQRDDEEDFVPVQSHKPAQKQTVVADDKAKKPKQRPKQEKDTNEDNEGFEFVGKQQKKPRTEEANPEAVTDKKFGKDHKKNDHPYKRGEGKVRVGSNQRAFDRHSGTGRGKEVKKEGAGGKYTWGNQDKNAQRDIVDYDDTDYYFNKALNPKKEEVIVEAKEEVKAEIKEEVVPSTETEVKEEEGKDGKKDRKKKKGVETAEVDEKDKLIIPENAITLEELKQKKAAAAKEEKVEKVEIKVDLEPIENKKVEVTAESKKKGKKAKNDQVNPKEVDINKLVKIATEDDTRGGRKNFNNNNKKNNNKFKFNDKDFPQL